MLTPRSNLTRRIMASLDASPARIPVLLGGCGSGRTTLLQQVGDRIGRLSVQHIDVERTATTPERFFRAIAATSPYPAGDGASGGVRQAFDQTLAFFDRARTPSGEPATFLLDEFLELRTFESFPGLRRVLHELIDALSGSANRFVLTSRYGSRALRLFRDRSSPFEVIQVPPLSIEDTQDILGPLASVDSNDHDYLARTVTALSDGRPAYVRALIDELASAREHSGAVSDPISALAALLGTDARLSKLCGFSYELRLHRARGYGALKAILEILADQEGLTLTEISQRLQRTPGSTKDYLSWLEDVDLVTSRAKRYSFTDPLLRLWVRLHCRPAGPTEDDVARETHRYALPRLPQPAAPPQPAEGAFAMATVGSGSGIIEID